MMLAKKIAAEFLGTAFLLVAVVGSGIMGERLSGGNAGIALLANSLATAGALFVLITALGPISGGHFNPLVSASEAFAKKISWQESFFFFGAQIAGAFAGVLAAHAMFQEPLLAISANDRSGAPQIFSEAVATFGLLLTMGCCSRFTPRAIPAAIACYIGAAYWFTSSTSFANPAVTFARAFTNTFTGIRMESVPGFFLGQSIGALLAIVTVRWIFTPAKAGSSPIK